MNGLRGTGGMTAVLFMTFFALLALFALCSCGGKIIYT